MARSAPAASSAEQVTFPPHFELLFQKKTDALGNPFAKQAAMDRDGVRSARRHSVVCDSGRGRHGISISLGSLREKIIAFVKMTVKTTLLTAAWASP
jgi:hypothetical protein